MKSKETDLEPIQANSATAYPITSLLFQWLIHTCNALWMIRIILINYHNYLTPYYKDEYVLFFYNLSLILFSIYWMKWIHLEINIKFDSAIKLRQAFEFSFNAISKLMPYFFNILINYKIIEKQAFSIININNKSIEIKTNGDLLFLFLKNKLIILVAFIFSILFLLNFFEKIESVREFKNNWVMHSIVSILIFQAFVFALAIFLVLIKKGFSK